MNLGKAVGKTRPRLLLVAATGGHLEQLYRISVSNEIAADSCWVTFRTPQSESLLAGKRVVWIPEIRSRDMAGAIKALPSFRRLIHGGDFDAVVSTGSAVAVPAFAAARLGRVPSLYVESFARADGPSLTGKIVQRTGLASSTWTQHEAWSSPAWEFHGSVLDHYRGATREQSSGNGAFITVGTSSLYRFDALQERMRELVHGDTDTVWQAGPTPVPELPGRVLPFVRSDEFDLLASSARVVVTHAGVGSILRLFSLGIYPVVVPRSVRRGEAVDDHQRQIARLLHDHDLGTVCEVEELGAGHLEAAAARSIVPQLSAPS